MADNNSENAAAVTAFDSLTDVVVVVVASVVAGVVVGVVAVAVPAGRINIIVLVTD